MRLTERFSSKMCTFLSCECMLHASPVSTQAIAASATWELEYLTHARKYTHGMVMYSLTNDEWENGNQMITLYCTGTAHMQVR